MTLVLIYYLQEAAVFKASQEKNLRIDVLATPDLMDSCSLENGERFWVEQSPTLSKVTVRRCRVP